MIHNLSHHRHGITLVEVLISIGIVAIGLTSVMSLIPAGKSEAGKALVYDRASSMAMNGLADAVTYGLTRPNSITVSISSGTTTDTIFFDPFATTLVANGVGTLSNSGTAFLKTEGIFAQSSSTTARNDAAIRLFAQGRDDVSYNAPDTDDAPPTNEFVNGIRSFDGRMSTVFALSGTHSWPLMAGEQATLSVVVYHNRDLATPFVSGTLVSSGMLRVNPADPSWPTGRTVKQVVRSGTVIYCNSGVNSPRPRFSQIGMAAVSSKVDVDGVSVYVYVTFIGKPPDWAIGTQTYVLVDSVGLAEQVVTLESQNAFSP